MPAIRSKTRGAHAPLDKQLIRDDLATGSFSEPGRRKKRKIDREEEKEETGLDLSERILALAREQQQEIEQEGRIAQCAPARMAHNLQELKHGDHRADLAATGQHARSRDASDSSDEESELEDNDEEIYEEIEVDEGDQAILDAFMPSQSPRNLADIIMAKIEQHEASSAHRQTTATTVRGIPANANSKVVEVYTKVGQLLSRYKSGPLPKAFKILPTLQVWPSLLALTEPDKWTPHAALAATKIFVSSLDAKGCQRFFSIVLYDRIRDEIADTKKLSVHSYQALKKALYKPAAFFKGVLFPLCESGTCTLKEAVILGSVLAKVSVPVLHSGAALLRLAEMEYSGPTSLFIRVLLDKKYALPYKVVDALVFHFLRFKRDTRELPVLWHQAFLVFVQRYKTDMTPEQKEALLEVIRTKTHHQITPEIRREISSSKARGELDAGEQMDEDTWV